MTAALEPHEAILKTLPHLRAFAISLTGDMDRADDLVQETILRALSHLHQFQPGTSMQAWLFTILRNQFHTLHRRRKREVEDPDGIIASRVPVAPEQGSRLDWEDLQTALKTLPVIQREALLLVAVEGFSYEEAAMVCNTKVGTIKSRINRARMRLAELTGVEKTDDTGPDRVVKAALQDGSAPPP